METLLWIAAGFVVIAIFCTIATEVTQWVMWGLFGQAPDMCKLADAIHCELKPDPELDAALRANQITSEQKARLVDLYTEAAVKAVAAYVNKAYPV
jgi:hypothetical protein